MDPKRAGAWRDRSDVILRSNVSDARRSHRALSFRLSCGLVRTVQHLAYGYPMIDEDKPQDGTDGSAVDEAAASWSSMLRRGILDPRYHDAADSIFGQMDFTLLVLHVHLLIEKGLNHHLSRAGVPDILLTSPERSLTFDQKQRAYMAISGRKATGQNLLTVLNTLRNNIAHDFWDDRECLRDAFQRFLGKKHQKIIEETALTPVDSVKLLWVMLSTHLGIVQEHEPRTPPHASAP